MSMAYALRDYQAQAVDASLTFLQQPPVKRGAKAVNGLAVCPTGGGKSLVIAKIVEGLDAPALVFQPSREILLQNAEKFAAFGFDPAIFSASVGLRQVGQITLATIGSVKDHAERFSHVRYVIVDEADLVCAKTGMYKTFLEALDHVRILGLTATPYRLSRAGGASMLKFLTRTRPRVFTAVVHVTQAGDLFQRGYLAPLEYQPVSGFTRARVQANTVGSDFDDAALKRYYNATGFAERLVRVGLRAQAVGRKNNLIFTKFVDEAREVAAAVGGAVVSGETPIKERANLIADFKAGHIHTMVNVGILNVGFDFPALDTVTIAAPTMSLRRFYQQIGRCVRPHPSKESGWVIDMCDNLSVFGKVEDLVLAPGGKSGEKWEVTTNGRPLTNVYFGGPPATEAPEWLTKQRKRQHWQQRRAS